MKSLKKGNLDLQKRNLQLSEQMEMLKLQYQEAIDQKHLEINHKIDTIRKLEEALDSKDDTEMRSLRDKVKILEMLVEKRDVSIGKS